MQNKEKDVIYCGVREGRIDTAQPLVISENIDLFAHWIEERYKVHLRKEAGKPQPWTEDPIIANYRFTNVRREQDRQTKYLIDNIVNNSELTIRDKVINIILFRYWNVWQTMKDFGGPWTRKELMTSAPYDHATDIYNSFMAKTRKHGFFTGAFLTSGARIGVKTAFNTDNAATGAFFLAQFAIKNRIPERVIKAADQKESYEVFKELPGVANFLGYQMWVDCTYIPDFPFSENEFTVAGPGCKNGLRRLFKSTDGMTPEECVFWLRDNLPILEPDLRPMDFMADLPEEDRFLSVMSLENCLCEFSKYHRAYIDQGRPKQKYTPYTGEEDG